MARQVITILLDNVSTAQHIETIVLNNQDLNFKGIKEIVREEIGESEGYEYAHDDRISDWVDRINQKWDMKFHEVMTNMAYDIVKSVVDEDAVDIMEIELTQLFDGLPDIDVGMLENEIKACRKTLVLEWKARANWNFMSTYSVSSEQNDYFVIITELPEV